MRNKGRWLTQAAVIAALYVALSYLQNFLVPGSATWMIQFRVSEALCVLAFFTPAAIWGLTVGCFLFNLQAAGSMPLDLIVGPLATALACGGMYLSRNFRIKKYPLFGLLLPALSNGVLVGAELAWYFGGGFWLNAACVAAGEVAVLLSLGSLLYITIDKRFRSVFSL